MMSIFPKKLFNFKKNSSDKSQKTINKNEKSDYEEHIKNHYTTQGYTVWHHKNRDITFVAKRKQQILLIHCCDSQSDISVEGLKSFQAQRDQFKKENPVFENYELSLHYIMSGFFITEEAYRYMESHKGGITYEVIKNRSNNNWLNSLLLDKKSS